ncbi:MAG: MmgE/PrpD family protein [Candidatus Latescibacteria bacterium]|nr:MmgE/PrpD family protein [Candidatus Latescibacterota bacterium]NIM21416.1 MmgE/PrpD family protein [Candidatus Latescibacterota bacterium]NIM65597.1 MmgE/PrpD family protein [Candidatus Latescibacterota bacterium]NIO01977.1 MmgE/PrpD family protein [Candidatus Latescibacterota bacterium]NIO28789.1 MmgE/PrpD family protein [Candidatus Latescibacterota bacterium]
MSTITESLAGFAAGLRYDDLPDEAIAAGKHFIFDTLGCALGGLKQEDPSIYAQVLKFLGGNPQATILGTGEKASLVQATLMNSLLVRVMEYNDIYWSQDPSHPSGLIPVALAVGEYNGKSGLDTMVAIIIAYDIEMRLCDFAKPGIRERGWHHATLTQLASPFVAGKLLDLTPLQMVNAAGISGSCHCSMGAVTAGKLTMMKNTVDPLASAAGVEAALLAKEGYTGPEHVIDGKEGLMQVLGDSWDENAVLDGLGERFKIAECGMKAYPTEALTHAPITATLRIVRENKLKPEDIRAVWVKTIARAADILSDPTKYDPKSKETADHSLPYCLAAALARGKVTPEEFTEENINASDIRRFLPMIRVEADDSYEALFPIKQPTLVAIETVSGERFEAYVEYPKGHPRMPMEKEELLQKFSVLASPEMSEQRIGSIYDLVQRFENLDSLIPLVDAIRIK